ncbi:hypothetical protein JCM6882_009439 [Rhodosporidiobolus microsporus]
MTTHHRTHSLTSSTGSLTDDLALPTSSSRHDPFGDDGGYAYGAQGAGDTSMSASDFGDSPYLGRGHSRRSSAGVGAGGAVGGGGGASSIGGPAGGGRSRARAFSFLSAHHPYGAREGDLDGVSPSTGETPFVGGGYDYALDAEEEDEVDALSSGDEAGGMEMRPMGEASPRAGGGRAYRSRFQPLDGVEYVMMGVSAMAVVGLTVGAVVLTWVG